MYICMCTYIAKIWRKIFWVHSMSIFDGELWPRRKLSRGKIPSNLYNTIKYIKELFRALFGILCTVRCIERFILQRFYTIRSVLNLILWPTEVTWYFIATGIVVDFVFSKNQRRWVDVKFHSRRDSKSFRLNIFLIFRPLWLFLVLLPLLGNVVLPLYLF